MISKTAIQASLFALAGGLMLIAAADNAVAQSMDRLADADANGDGNIEWQEMLDMRAGIFERLDRNGDGFADSTDTPRLGPARSRFSEALTSIQGADTNSDGRISKTEMLDAPAQMFEQGDTNGDKVLSAEEITALRESGAGQR